MERSPATTNMTGFQVPVVVLRWFSVVALWGFALVSHAFLASRGEVPSELMIPAAAVLITWTLHVSAHAHSERVQYFLTGRISELDAQLTTVAARALRIEENTSGADGVTHRLAMLARRVDTLDGGHEDPPPRPPTVLPPLPPVNRAQGTVIVSRSRQESTVDLEAYLAEAADAYELGRRAGLAERAERAESDEERPDEEPD